MKFLVLVMLSTWSIISLAQSQIGGGYAINKLPKGNPMVDTTLQLFSYLRKGEINRLMDMPNITVSSDYPIDTIQKLMMSGEIIDTTMSESYFFELSTTSVRFTIDCTNHKKDLLFNFEAKSSIANSGLKDYRVILEEDTTSLKIKREIMNLLVPKE